MTHSHDERVLADRCCGAPWTVCPSSRNWLFQHATDRAREHVTLERGVMVAIAGVSAIVMTVVFQRLQMGAVAWAS